MNYTQPSGKHLPQPPLNFATLAEPLSVLQTSNKLCENLQQSLGKLVSTVTPAKATFDNVVRELLQHENEMQFTSNFIAMIALVAPDTALRNAASEASDKISQYTIDCKASNMDLFRLLDTVYQRQKDDHTLDSESRKALAEERQSYTRRGMSVADIPLAGDTTGSGLDGSSTTFGGIARRLQSIQSEFVENLDERPHCIWLTRAELAGVWEDEISGLENGTGELDGKLRLDLNSMQARWMLSVVSSPATRQNIYLETRRMVSQDGSFIFPTSPSMSVLTLFDSVAPSNFS